MLRFEDGGLRVEDEGYPSALQRSLVSATLPPASGLPGLFENPYCRTSGRFVFRSGDFESAFGVLRVKS